MASTRRGSLRGKGGCAAYCLKKTMVKPPPRQAQQPKWSQIQARGKPSGCRTGMTLKERSNQCMSQAQAHKGIMKPKTFFTSMRSKARNGSRKCPKMIIIPTHHQVPFSRTTYQKVSSGIFPFQIMKYWPKWM